MLIMKNVIKSELEMQHPMCEICQYSNICCNKPYLLLLVNNL